MSVESNINVYFFCICKSKYNDIQVVRLEDQNYLYAIQKQPPRRVLSKRCPENMQQVYRRTPMPNCDFNKVGHKQWCIIDRGALSD